MPNISNIIREVLFTDDPLILADLMRGTQWATERSGGFAGKMDDVHSTMRLGMLAEHMENWAQEHPDATDEQIKASVKRYAAFIGSNPSFFKRVRLETSLRKRTDLQTSLDQ